jgi:6-phosphogluconolactonase/glucosamine-6-phosphate isomerase/deaminase
VKVGKMVNELAWLLQEQNLLLHQNSGISVVTVADQEKGFDLASNIISSIVDKKSVLYLSGGKTPKELYSKLAQEESLTPGAIGLVDERYGERFHANSNEKMIQDTGFLRYLEILDIPFYPILKAGLSREETAREYDAKIRSLQSTFPKHIGILGIGMDGHTAGLPAQNSKFETQKSKIYNTNDLVTEYDDTSGKYGERVTMTFIGLAMLDILLVLVFGREKKSAIDIVFGEGSEEEVPGRFYKRPEIAQKTLLITDQGF